MKFSILRRLNIRSRFAVERSQVSKKSWIKIYIFRQIRRIIGVFT
jgi:hypothetical protein